MRRSTCQTVLTVLAVLTAVAAAGAAVYWLLFARKRTHGCLCTADAYPCGGDCCDDASENVPCESFSDGTAAEDTEA